MKIFLQTARLALPTLFFGYAIVANFALATAHNQAVVLPENGLLSGGLTRDLDATYKKDLLHMPLSFSLIGAARYALLGEVRKGAIVGEDGWLFTAEELREGPSDVELQGIVATVHQIQTHLMRSGTDLVVVPLPAKLDLYRALGPDVGFGQDLEDLYLAFATQLSAEGIDVVDVRSALQNPVHPVFFATDTHWTPYGATLVAEAVGASGTIAKGGLAFDRVEQAPKVLTGDLISFVTSAALAPRLGLSAESVAVVAQSQLDPGSDIFGAVEQDIVLVGTSYSANPDWGFADALMQVLGRDVVSFAKQGLGPLQPVQDYLATQDFQDTPPAVVIWEIPIRYLTDPTLWPERAGIARDIAALPPKETSDG